MTALDDFGIPRKSAPDENSLAHLTAQDMTGDGGLFAKGELSAGVSTTKEAARHIAMLGGWDYDTSGVRFQKDLQGAARWVLSEMGGDLDEFTRYYLVLDKQRVTDAFLRDGFNLCQSPYGVARKVMALWNKEKAASAKEAKSMTDWIEVAEQNKKWQSENKSVFIGGQWRDLKED